jgi:hypothetical protein
MKENSALDNAPSMMKTEVGDGAIRRDEKKSYLGRKKYLCEICCAPLKGGNPTTCLTSAHPLRGTY